jgi:hypothetical protein
MRIASKSCVVVALALSAVAAVAQAPANTTDRSQPFVVMLESQFHKLQAAERAGDVETYRLYRASAPMKMMEERARAANRPFSELLKAMGPMQPDLGKYRFLRCDVIPTAARLAYTRDIEPDAAQERVEFMVILFNLESGSWKVANMGSVNTAKKGANLDEATRDPRLQLPRK